MEFSLSDIIAILNFFGITVENAPKYTIFVLFLIIAMWLLIRRPLGRRIDKVETFLISFCGAIQTGGDLSKIDLFKKNSPISLSEEGEKAIKKTGFKKAIDENITFLFKTINKSKPKSALDAERFCVGLIRFFIIDKDIKIFKEVEDFLYNNPKYNKPDYYKAAGLYLRDKYLDKYPELKPQKK